MRPTAALQNQDKDHVFAIVLMAGAFLYTLARALLIPVFHDEAYTYFTYVQAPLPVILSELGNNHILNTLLIKWSAWLFGMSELSLRLPALGGHLLFLSGVYRTLDLFLEKKTFVAGVVVLTLNPFILELFSAARGYALGLGLFMQAVYYFLRNPASLRSHDLTLVFSFLVLAVQSHLSFLYVYVSALIVAGTDVLRHHGWFSRRAKRTPEKILWRDYGFPLILSGMLLLVLFRPVLIQLKTGGFYHGGDTGFWSDTVRSLGTAALYSRVILPEGGWFFVFIAVAGCMVAPGVFLINRLRKTHILSREEVMLARCFSLLLGTAGLIVASHNLLGTKYVVGRMAVFLLPLFWLTMALFWRCLFNATGTNMRFWLTRLAGAVAAAGLVVFLTSMNFKSYAIAPHDHLSRQIIRVLLGARQQGALGTGHITLGTHGVFVPGLHFYREKHRLAWLEVVDLSHAESVACDTYYIFERTAPGVQQYNVSLDFTKIKDATREVLSRYPAEGTVLVFSPSPGR